MWTKKNKKSTELPIPENGVVVGVKKHKVVVVNEMVVYVHHMKSCNKPCEVTKEIVDYLEAELFVKEGYNVSDV